MLENLTRAKANNPNSKHQEQIWVWPQPDTGDDLFYDHQETVRFRIESEKFHDASPVGPEKPDDDGVGAGGGYGGIGM
jgi:hypothetical protein